MLRLWILTCRVVGVFTLAGFLLAAFTSAPNAVAHLMTVPPDLGPAEAIVVLGASANRDGSLGDASLRRAIRGIRLYREGLAPRVLFFGMYGEAETRARLAAAMGVNREAILIEPHEPTTRDEAERAGTVLAKRLGVRTILLVTDALHMRRASALFERAGLKVRAAPTQMGALLAGKPEERLRLTRTVGQELMALSYHKLFGYL
jgi:uncharacterized SAM-binding protein YcdF (DUF218 family)